MRIYEYAKEKNISSKELISILSEAGFDISSHMAVLTPEAIYFLDKKFTKKPKEIKKTIPKPDQGQKKKMLKEPQKEKLKTIPKKEKIKEKKKAPEKKETPISQKEKKLVVRPMSIANFAKETGKPVTEVILTLLKWGIIATINQILQEDVVLRLAKQYGIEVQEFEKTKEAFEKKIVLEGGRLQERYPVVVVMGHVDHGKTTLLDFIRKARVAAKEKGGITQHLGAYEVKIPQGGIVFLDTPGHEAFSKIRLRGARAADIAVLVIAADDGIMPQTIEAISHAKSMKLPIIVAINKVDKATSSQIEAVKHGLSQHDLLPEDWGGETICVPISAKLGQGVDHLLEMIALQSQLMELRADRDIPARGYVLESKIEKGRGPVATLICQHGVAKIGDFFVCGNTFGKISSMVNSHGSRVKFASPSTPVQVAGFDSLPEAGDFFEVVSQQEHRKAKLGKREKKPDIQKVLAVGSEGSINLIVKADSDSSREALLESIERISKGLERGFNIIHSAVGDINESDVDLAAISGALIVGFHVKAEAKAASSSQRLGISIILFDIIYKLLEYLQEFSEGQKEVKKEIKKIGEAIVLRVFKIKKVGVIAGCIVREGRFSKGGRVVVWRGKTKVGEGKIVSLQREKKTVKEVHAGFECGFVVDGFDNWEVDDKVECYLEVAEEK